MAHYFAYGSNMCTARLQERVPSAKPIGRAVLKGWKFICNNKSSDCSAKASIEECAGEEVRGVLFEFDDDELELDRHEGFCTTYNKKLITVIKDDGTMENDVMTYVGKKPKKEIKPYDWYMKYIICGADEHELLGDYIQKLKLIETKEDKRSCNEKGKKCCNHKS